MRSILVMSVATVAAAAVCSTTVWSAGPKLPANAVFGAASAVVLNDGNNPPVVALSGVIKKGQKKRVVAVEAAMQMDVSVPSLPSLSVQVNGVAANGPTVTIDCKFTNTNRCPLAGSWWLDLDQAEAAHPGTFIGKPLTIQLLAGNDTVAPPTNPSANVTMTARLVKK
jgi:hypothetical protein